MSEVDDEVYSTIFSALRHGVRRRILRMLSEGHMSFTSLYESLGVSSSHLTYHLDSLGELVSKNDAKYKLSVFGEAAVDMMSSVEDSPRYLHLPGLNPFKVVSAVLLIALLSMSGIYINLYDVSQTQRDSLAENTATIDALMSRLEGLSGLPQLKQVMVGEHTKKIASRHNLRYWYEIGLTKNPPTRYQAMQNPTEESILVFYAPYDSLRLSVYLSIQNLPEDFYLPVTLQKGNALVNESGVVLSRSEFIGVTYLTWGAPIIWSKNVTGWGGWLDIEIPHKGWYTLSLTGPVSYTQSGDPHVSFMWGPIDDWLDILSLYVSGHCELLDGEKQVFFALETDVRCGREGWAVWDYVWLNNGTGS